MCETNTLFLLLKAQAIDFRCVSGIYVGDFQCIPTRG